MLTVWIDIKNMATRFFASMETSNILSRVELKNCLIQLYMSNKTEHFSYKGECGVHILSHLKVDLT